MRYRPSVSYLMFDEQLLRFDLCQVLFYDKFISKTRPLKGAIRYLAHIATPLEDYFWLDRII